MSLSIDFEFGLLYIVETYIDCEDFWNWTKYILYYDVATSPWGPRSVIQWFEWEWPSYDYIFEYLVTK